MFSEQKADQVLVSQFPDTSFDDSAGSLAYFLAFSSKYSEVVGGDIPI
jgi:hypothetical protein